MRKQCIRAGVLGTGLLIVPRLIRRETRFKRLRRLCLARGARRARFADRGRRQCLTMYRRVPTTNEQPNQRQPEAGTRPLGNPQHRAKRNADGKEASHVRENL